MIDSHFRQTYQRWCVDPPAKFLSAKNVSPHIVTLAALFSGCLSAALLAYGQALPALCALVLSGYCDTLDGSLARSAGTSSSQGAVYDIVSDRIVEGSIILGLYAAHPDERALACLAMLAAILICVTSFLVVGIFAKNTSEKSFHYSAGIMERTEAFFFFGAMILFPQTFPVLSWTFVLLVLLTAAIRLKQFHPEKC